jgi:signal transduction histidine kinase
VRHSPDGGTVELRATATQGVVGLTVSDQGGGILPEHLPHVFDRFYKADAGRAAGEGGSGLGLSIVRAIVQRHGGTISVTSAPGRTEFVVSLPQTTRWPAPSSADQRNS